MNIIPGIFLFIVYTLCRFSSTEDPQMCAENAQKIITYIRNLETKQGIKPKFLAGSIISGKMRAVLINWLAEVHLQFKLMQETLYLTVGIVDR